MPLIPFNCSDRTQLITNFCTAVTTDKLVGYSYNRKSWCNVDIRENKQINEVSSSMEQSPSWETNSSSASQEIYLSLGKAS